MKTVVLSRLIILGAFLVLIVGGVRIGMKRFYRVPVRVASGSMAPALIGPHVEQECRDCGFPLVCGVEHLPDTSAVCSNCGSQKFASVQPATATGQRVYIDRGYQGGVSLERWRLIAFADPTDRTRMAVKRVVALPGENVSLHAGDVFVNNARIEKSLADFLSLAVLVHDDRYRPPADTGIQHRWQGDSAGSNWQPANVGYVCSYESTVNDERHSDDIDWLVYRNLRCFASPAGPRRETPIHDAYAYNQSLARKPNAVVDIGLSCRCELTGDEIAVAFRQVEPVCLLRLNTSTGLATITLGDEVVDRKQVTTLLHRKQFQLTAVWCDGRLLVGIDHQPVLATRIDAEACERATTAQPLALGTSNGALSVKGLRVLRDLYYLSVPTSHSAKPSQEQLDENDLFVLGDNSPDSRDSRYWRAGGLKLKDIIGRVVR